MTDVGDVLVEEILRFVLEYPSDRGRDILEQAFERENMDEVLIGQLCSSNNAT